MSTCMKELLIEERLNQQGGSGGGCSAMAIPFVGHFWRELGVKYYRQIDNDTSQKSKNA